MSRNEEKISKFLSYVLRHRPDSIGLVLDANGWAQVSDLIARAPSASIELTETALKEVVSSNAKQRFAFNDDFTKIRANQGHSIEIDLAIESKQPPEFLYHGTATRFLYSIRQQGLIKISRQHVHLSPDEATAITVGQRHGKPVVLRILAGEMHRAGKIFFLSNNGVWLTDAVEQDFIEFPIQ